MPHHLDDQLVRLTTVGTMQIVAPLLGFTAAMFAFYCGVPFVLRWGGAAVLNLSLLTSDLWAAAAQIALFGAYP